MKKFFVLFLAAVIFSTLFVSCQRRGPRGADGQQIRVLLANHPYGDLLRPLIPEFERETGISVLVEQLQENILYQNLITEFATGVSTVDVFMTRPLQEALLFTRNSWYAPLHDFDFSDFPAPTVDVGRMNGIPHLVPLVTETQVLYYRRDLFEAAGLSVPTTFEELENAARALTRDDIAGIGVRGAGNPGITQFATFLYNFGGRYLVNGRAVIDSPQAIEALRFYGRLLGNYGPAGITAMSWDQLMPVFQAGRIAMWADASVFFDQLVDPANTVIPRENVGVARMPRGPAADNPIFAVAWGMAMANSTRDRESSMSFLNWATSSDMALRAMLLNIPMARISVWYDPQVQAAMHPGLIEAMLHAGQVGYPFDRPFMTSVGQARDIIGQLIVETINTSGNSPQLEAMATRIAAEVNDLLRHDGDYGR